MADQKSLTPKEAAAQLRVHPATVRKYINEGQLKATLLPSGRHWRISAEEVNKFTGNGDGEK